MKITTVVLTFLMSFQLSFQAQAEAPLNTDYESLLRDVRSCKRSVYGCTIEQELEIARFKGYILDPNKLEKYLAQDKEKSIFIPLALNDEELLTLAAATSLGIVAFSSDQEIMDVVQKNKSKITEPLTDVGYFLGSGPAAWGIAAGSYFIGMVYHKNHLKKAGLFIVGSSIATSIAAAAAKETFGRKRPIKGAGPYAFFQPDSKSFYSGHATQAFSVATVISEVFKEEYPIVPYVAYGLAAITGYARMHEHAHWASDVIVGAIAGHLITKLTMNAMSGNAENRSGLEIYPGIDSLGNFAIFLEWKGKETEPPLKCANMPEGMSKIEACLAEGFEKAGRK